MSETVVGVIGIVALFFFLFARMPVGMALLVVGFGGIWVIDGQRAAIATMSSILGLPRLRTLENCSLATC